MGYILRFQILIYIFPHSLQRCGQYYVILDRVIPALNSTLVYPLQSIKSIGEVFLWSASFITDDGRWSSGLGGVGGLGGNNDGILPKGPYPPCLRMADRALLAGCPRSKAASLSV